MFSNKRATIRQDLADVKGRVEEINDTELKDKFEKLQDDLLSYLESVDNALVDLR